MPRKKIKYYENEKSFQTYSDGPTWGWSRIGEGQKAPTFPKICNTYPAMLKLGTVIPFLKKIQKIYESSNTALEFCCISIFHRKSGSFAIQRNADADCIVINNFSFNFFES